MKNSLIMFIIFNLIAAILNFYFVIASPPHMFNLIVGVINLLCVFYLIGCYKLEIHYEKTHRYLELLGLTNEANHEDT